MGVSKAKLAKPKIAHRPSAYDETAATEVLRRMSEGETLTAICREPGFPSASSMNLWAINDSPPGFSARYARARELQSLAIGESAINLADDCKDAVKARLQVDTRKWFASKMHPSKFGEKVTTEHTGKLDISIPFLGRRSNLISGDGNSGETA